MNMIFKFIYLFLCLSFVLSEPFAEYKVDKYYLLKKSKSKIFIDGKLNEESWDNANQLSDFMSMNHWLGKKPTQKTSVKIISDNENINVLPNGLVGPLPLITEANEHALQRFQTDYQKHFYSEKIQKRFQVFPKKCFPKNTHGSNVLVKKISLYQDALIVSPTAYNNKNELTYSGGPLPENGKMDKFLELEGAKDLSGFTLKYREDPIFLDPRLKELGGRLIINLEKLYLSLKKLNLKSENPEIYYDHSFNLGVPQLQTNKLKEKLFGIECNFEELNGIDFKKGCYVGQENTARIKLKNKLSKRLLPVEIIDGKLDEDETVYCNQIEIGKILINEEYPFALIKFSNENFNKDLTLKSKNASFKIFIPEWLKI